MSDFDKLTFLLLEGTGGNQQMKGKLMKLLAPQKSQLQCSLLWFPHFCLLYHPNLLTINHPFDNISWMTKLSWDGCVVLKIIS